MTTADLVYRFDNAELHPGARQLRLQGKPASLGARAFDVLLALVTHRDRMLSKNELLDIVWPGLVVEENNLQVHVSALRKLLGSQAIVTIPGRGYRFAAVLEEAVAPQPMRAYAAAPALVDTEPGPVESRPQALPASRGHRGNLSAALSPLLGRDAELASLRDLVQQQRMVSVLGAGGIGKTSLARTAAQQVGHAFRDGAWMIELASVSDPSAVPRAVASALQMNLPGRDDPHAELAGRLRGGELLVLDNCEHLVAPVAAMVSDLLVALPELHILVTSQEPLRLAAERIVRLEALAVPAPDAMGRAAAHGAVALFVARVRAVQPGFVLDAGNVEAVVEICRELDGMPLALEFAAARVPLLGVAGVRQHLAQRLRVLKNGVREVPERHRTLRATLDWSHALLSPDEQKIFRRLGVFVGGFGLDLAQQVAADEAIDAWAVLDHLGNLVDKSMVVVDPGATPRYRLLETARAYAREQLDAAGERQALERWHAQCMLKFFDRRARYGRVGFESMDAWVHACNPEVDNLRTAIDWAAGPEGDAALALALVNIAAQFMYEAGRYPECMRWMRQVEPLIDAGTPEEVVAEFKFGLAVVGLHGDLDAQTRLRLLDDACAVFEKRPPHTLLVYILTMRAYVSSVVGDFKTADEALVASEKLVDLPQLSALRGVWLYIVGMVRRCEGRTEEAFAAFTQAMATVRSSGDTRTLFYLRNNIAALHHEMGHLDEAADLYRAALQQLQQSPRADPLMNAFMLNWYAHVLTAKGALREARTQVLLSLPYCRRSVGLRHFAGMLALLAARQGRLREAAWLIGADDAARQRRGEVRTPFDTRTLNASLALVAAAHPPALIEAWRLEGMSLDEDATAALFTASTD